MVIGVIFLIFRRRVKRGGDRVGTLSGNIAQQKQIIAVVLRVVGADEVPIVVEGGADVILVGNINVKSLLAFPLHKFSLVGGKIGMAEDKHFGHGQWEVPQVGGVKVVRQFLIGFGKGGGDALGKVCRLASGEGKFRIPEGADLFSVCDLGLDPHSEAPHFPEDEAVADAQGAQVSVLFRVKEIAQPVENVPIQSLNAQFRALEGQRVGPGHHCGLWGMGIAGLKILHWRSSQIAQPDADAGGGGLAEVSGGSVQQAQGQHYDCQNVLSHMYPPMILANPMQKAFRNWGRIENRGWFGKFIALIILSKK